MTTGLTAMPKFTPPPKYPFSAAPPSPGLTPRALPSLAFRPGWCQIPAWPDEACLNFLWSVRGAQILYIESGSPWENDYCESFNGRLRDELLNGEIFYSLKEAKVVIE
jgi:hypothetical protein